MTLDAVAKSAERRGRVQMKARVVKTLRMMIGCAPEDLRPAEEVKTINTILNYVRTIPVNRKI